MAFPTDWGRKCALTIDATYVDGTTHADFPVLFTVANLPSEMFDADGSYPALSGGGDIRFSSDSAGVTGLHCEVVSFTIDNNPANGTAEIWVNVPSISGSVDTDIYVWYNKSGETQPAASDATYGSEGVWANYEAVYHLGDADPSTAIVDSTGNGYGLTDTGMSSTDDVAGKIGNGLTFGASKYASYTEGTPAVIQDEPILLQAWMYPPNTSNNQQIVSLADSSQATYYSQINLKSSTDQVSVYRHDYGTTPIAQALSTTTYSATTWQMVHGVFTSSNNYAYLNGGGKGSASVTGGNISGHNRIGLGYTGDSTPSYSTNGLLLDEVRIGGFQPSDDWISTEYTSQNTPGTFASAGTPEAAAAGSVDITVPQGDLILSSTVPTVSATANISVTVPQANLTLSTTAPTVDAAANVAVIVPQADLVLSTSAPVVAVTANIAVTVPQADLLLSTTAPTVEADGSVSRTIPQADLALSASAPTVERTDNQSIEIPQGDLTLSSEAPTVSAGFNITVPGSNLILSTLAPAIAQTTTASIIVPTADLLLSTSAPTVEVAGPVSIEVPQANLSLSTNAPTVVDSGQLWTEVAAASSSWTEITDSSATWTEI